MQHPKKEIKTQAEVEYLVVVEVERDGFIVKSYKTLEKAKKTSEYLHLTAEHLGTNTDEKVKFLIGSFNNSGFNPYKIFGTEIYYRSLSVIEEISDGVISISILKIDPDKFCVKTFVKERQNCSSVFTELPEKYQENKFPFHYTIAN